MLSISLILLFFSDFRHSNEDESQFSAGDMFLDRCIIFLGSGFEGKRGSRLVDIIRNGGGTRLEELKGNVTHCIVADKSDR